MKIVGIKKIKKKIIKNKKGDILKFFTNKDHFYKKFGEIYFSEIKKNKIKGWNFHKKNTCLFTVPSGKVEFFFIDGRKKSKSYLAEQRIVVDKKNYFIILLPPKIWFSFKSFTKLSVIANCIEIPHSEKETKKRETFKGYKIS